MDIVYFLVVGLVAGLLASMVMGKGIGVLASLVVGMVGALLGGKVLGLLGVTVGGGLLGAIISAFAPRDAPHSASAAPKIATPPLDASINESTRVRITSRALDGA